MGQPSRLIIVADDLAGAADCGVAFAEQGIRTCAVLHAERVDQGDWAVLALDTDSRDADPDHAAERVRRALTGADPRAVLFKKVDSTLRGNLAAELRALLSSHEAPRVIAAPAFPATGRTTRNGRQLVNGRPLEETEFADQASTSAIAEHLAPVGLPLHVVRLADVRAGRLHAEVQAGEGIFVCDAETEADLDAIARDGARGGREVVWLGSAGLAKPLARVLDLPARVEHAAPRRPNRPLLFVIGSPSRATAVQLERLRAAPGVETVVLDHDAGRPGGAAARVRDALQAGHDCALTLPGEGTRDAGRGGTGALAAAAVEALDFAGGLVLTGGETARAVLTAASVTTVALAGEVRPGIALGDIEEPRALAVAIKAGGFGDEDALLTCRRRMSARESEEEPAWPSR